MKTLITLLLVALLQACGGGGGSSGSTVPQPVFATVEINSDSICAAVGIPTTCAQMMPAGWIVDDRAIAGLTLHSLAIGYTEVWAGGPLGKNGPQQAFNKVYHPSQFVVVELGANDAYSDYPADRYESELRAILLNIKATGKTPVVTGIVPFRAASADHPGFDAATVARALVLNSIVHRVAIELGALDAHWDAMPFNPDTDTVEGIHRTEPALRKLVQQLILVIQKAS